MWIEILENDHVHTYMYTFATWLQMQHETNKNNYFNYQNSYYFAFLVPMRPLD